ncbi:ESX secretion-associated protein EspG [Mycolicibacterium komossense]|uniref:ESX secretion-associated protein EspG n=1 Tax=Mycolicibacterium komossense TaxID=1779 RepID=A0ABT3C9Q1_9MYCO|nr:ESX secretion-associated protein EspG [Mycolicibacterium komossense]MCV7226207.1 ESX secretion-associated protein EspG [Mycolicibacterium komossense]
MLTTTLDGLWALQVLTGIEVLAPELGLRPVLPSVESKQSALDHPVAAELLEAGVIDEHGDVDPAVVEWLTVLSRRDVALYMQARTPAGGAVPAMVTLARFAQWWVTLERTDYLVRLSGAGTASAESAASQVITSQVDRLCGTSKPAPLKPVTIPVDKLLESVRDKDSLRKFLMSSVQLDPDQMQLLMLAADPEQSAQASIVALQTGVNTGGPARVHLEKSVVTIIDTPEGRLVAEHVPQQGKAWMIMSPGSPSNIATAVNQMVRRLPAQQDWFSHRKVV